MKPFDDDLAVRQLKASGFRSARCWKCWCKASVIQHQKLVKCQITGGLVPYYIVKQRKARQDPLTHLRGNLRSLIYRAFERGSYLKNTKTAEILDCSFEELKRHLEDQFRPGMSWDNFGKEWVIDHHLPVSAATSLEEVVALNHYTNLVPLWKSENLSKGGRCDPEEVRAYLELVKRGA